MLNIKLEGKKGEVMQAIELLRNQTFKDNCSVLEKSWEEDNKLHQPKKYVNIKAEIELHLDCRDLYLYQVGDNDGLGLDLVPVAKTNEEMNYGGWEEGESQYMRNHIENNYKKRIHEPDGNVFRCKDGVFITKDCVLMETKISENSNLPLCVS